MMRVRAECLGATAVIVLSWVAQGIDVVTPWVALLAAMLVFPAAQAGIEQWADSVEREQAERR